MLGGGGCMAPCFRNENALQQGCGHLSQAISVLQSPPLPMQGLRVMGSSWECGMELYTEHCSWWQTANT